jgi:hypothetical protein
MALSDEKHCEMLSAHVRDRAEAMRDGFELFVQLFSALVGDANSPVRDRQAVQGRCVHGATDQRRDVRRDSVRQGPVTISAAKTCE